MKDAEVLWKTFAASVGVQILLGVEDGPGAEGGGSRSCSRRDSRPRLHRKASLSWRSRMEYCTLSLDTDKHKGMPQREVLR